MRESALKRSIGIWEGEKREPAKATQVSLIRQELVTLTGNHSRAVILNQLLYWTQRTKDFSLMVEEERNRDGKEERLQYGWIYKTANELIKETLLHVDRTTIRRYLNFLIKQGWLFERSNPQNKWDKTIQYRVNVRKIQKDLMRLGFTLSEISLWQLEDVFLKGCQNAKGQNASSNVYILPSKGHDALSNGHDAHSNEQNAPCNTETTSKITNKEHTQRTPAREDFNKNFFEEVLQIWKLHIGQDVHLTKERSHRLKVLLAQHFSNDLTQWKQFCERIKASPFLMGEGLRRWRVSLDWILNEANLLKVLEGNFDTREQDTRNQKSGVREQERQIILESIQDLTWKEWCVHLTQSYPNDKDPVTLGELRLIAHASFLEVENDRLVWIGSSDKGVLDAIEKLRLKLLPIIQKTFPKARNLRTRILPSPRHVSQTRETPLNLKGEKPYE
ncbi:MAG TPA: hypothetical protein DEP85_05070 [Holosporales bacterium]|nr:hypothetical protein [Holosporales bacterium]